MAEKVNREIPNNLNSRNASDKTDLPRMSVQRRKIRKQRWDSLETTEKFQLILKQLKKAHKI